MPTPDQHLIEELYRELGGDTPNDTAKGTPGTSKLTDSEVLDKLFTEKDRGAEFRDIYHHGEYLKHHPQWTNSEAVGSLLRKFAYWTNGDPTQMERLIRGSKLESRKFDERRSGSTWLGKEIADAVAETPKRYQGDDGTRLNITHNGRPINSHSRSHSLGSTGTRDRRMESLKRSIQVVSREGGAFPARMDRG